MTFIYTLTCIYTVINMSDSQLLLYIYTFEIYYSDILMTRKILYSVIEVTDTYIICSHQISHFLVFSILYLNGWKFWKILWYRVSAGDHLRYYVVKLRGHQNGRLTYIFLYSKITLSKFISCTITSQHIISDTWFSTKQVNKFKSNFRSIPFRYKIILNNYSISILTRIH